MNEEIKELLGIKTADFVVYAAFAAVVWMYYTKSVAFDVILAVVATTLCGLSCLIGMSPDARLTAMTNWIKRVAYPACLVAVLVCVYLNFTKWNAL